MAYAPVTVMRQAWTVRDLDVEDVVVPHHGLQEVDIVGWYSDPDQSQSSRLAAIAVPESAAISRLQLDFALEGPVAFAVGNDSKMGLASDVAVHTVSVEVSLEAILPLPSLLLS